MTEDNDDKPFEPLEKLAYWLLVNHKRPTWEVLAQIAQGWPDTTAAEIARAWQRMNEIALAGAEKDIAPIRRRAGFRTVEGGKKGEGTDKDGDQ